jgi:hypothetical protein
VKIAAGANFIKLFWHNLHRYWHIAISFDSGYTARGHKLCQKSFVKLDTGANFLKLFGA